jgi:hypothetical protein
MSPHRGGSLKSCKVTVSLSSCSWNVVLKFGISISKQDNLIKHFLEIYIRLINYATFSINFDIFSTHNSYY